MPSTQSFSGDVANNITAAYQKLSQDYAALPSNASQEQIATVQADVVNYYQVQQGERGYASLAASVAGGSDYNGLVADRNLESISNRFINVPAVVAG